MNLDRARAIPGYMYEEELVWLATQAATHHSIAEIGSYMGRSTRALADNTPGQVWAIDTFTGSPEHQEFLKDKPSLYLYDMFMLNMEGLTNVHPLMWSSTDAATLAHLWGLKFDMIFIDAAHDYESVKADILAWRPLLTDGGLLCGHDYHEQYNIDYPGVIKAVDELIPKVKRETGWIWSEVR